MDERDRIKKHGRRSHFGSTVRDNRGSTILHAANENGGARDNAHGSAPEGEGGQTWHLEVGTGARAPMKVQVNFMPS